MVMEDTGGVGVVLKNIGVLSCGKVLGALYALLGLLIGLPIALFSLGSGSINVVELL
jgi:hypothetical protein